MESNDNVTDGITRTRDGPFTGPVVKLYNPDTVQTGDVLAPLTLVAFSVICVGWMLVVLFREILLEMSGSKIPAHEPMMAMTWAFFGFVLPVITALAIHMNWSSSRWMIVLLVLGTGNLLILEASPTGIWSADSGLIASVAAVGLCVLWWLFASRSVRHYYLRLDGKAIPKDEGHTADHAERSQDRLAPILELVGFMVIFVGFIAVAAWRFNQF